ncbi:hypothetical protein BH10PLA1_BH10PLA1_00010 [soil metagenome]
MKKWMKQIGVAVLGTMAITAPALRADPLDLKNVPADSKWLIHLDMDAATKSAAWQPLYDHLQRNDDFENQVGQVETMFNAHFPEDLHDVTLCGAEFGDGKGVLLVHAKVDRTRIEAGLASNPDYANEAHGNHAILTWTDKGKTNYGGFYSDTLFIVGQDKSRVAATIDTLEGKSPSLTPDATLAQGLAKQGSLLAYVSGEDLAKLRQAQVAKSPLIAQMKSGWIELVENKDDMVLKVTVSAVDAATATKMKTAAEGIRSALSLAAGEPDAKPGVKFLADLTSSAVASVNENQVSVELHVPQKDVPALIDKIVALKSGRNP